MPSPTTCTPTLWSALRRAVTSRDAAADSTAGVIFHADRGCQYTSTQLAYIAEELDVRLSVGRTGVCLLTTPSRKASGRP